MSVTQLRAQADEPSPADFMPAIRTPEQFRNAHNRIGDLLSGLTTGDLGNATEIVAEVQNLRRALDASPFCILGDEVVARGFHPRIISRLH